MFQDGPLTTITPASEPEGAFLGPDRPHDTPGYKTPHAGRYLPGGFDGPSKPTLARPGRSAPAQVPAEPSPGESDRKRFPFNNFTCCLTLFPKCFSSFDHSTCALSVSGPYLALDEIYHPFRAAFPNNSTRRGSFTQAQPPVADGILTLSDVPSQGTWTGTGPEASSPNYNSDPGRGQISNLSSCRFTRRY